MKNIISISKTVFLLCAVCYLTSCKKSTIPAVTTDTFSDITQTTALFNCNVTDDGNATITERGVCWNTSTAPTIANSRTIESGGMGSYTTNITQLTPNTLYYVRAYATNEAGTGYGKQVALTTSQTTLATLTTTVVEPVTQTTAVSGGNITADNGSQITSRGVCWSTMTNPTTDDNKTSDGTGIGTFTSNLTRLQSGTTYYVKAYAINSIGTSYGNELSFSTSPGAPSLATADITELTQISARSGGTIISNGGADITGRGVCWSTSPSPTTANDKTNDGIGEGSFISTMTGLTPETMYYVRAYAINSFGTGYGISISFTTKQMGLPVVTTTGIVDIISNSATLKGEVTSDEGDNVTARGFCWGTTHNPTTADNSISAGSGLGPFETTITGLLYGTTYYVRAWATSGSDIVYGNELEFTTQPVAVTVLTMAAEYMTSNSAKLNGTVTSDGGSQVIGRGFCFSDVNENPLFSNSISAGDGTGPFSTTATNLYPETKYYYRAYAINNVDTSYGDVMTFTTLELLLTDYDGFVYKTVKIGSQIWMEENLKTGKYNDGILIPLVENNASWASLTTPAFCWINNDDISNRDDYGALYNWYAVSTGKLCFSGWHVPSDEEMTELINYLGGESIAGGKLKESGTDHWLTPNTGATNESGFTARPGGFRFSDGTFNSFRRQGYWWNSTEHYSSYAWSRSMNNSDQSAVHTYTSKKNGYSIRCIKNY